MAYEMIVDGFGKPAPQIYDYKKANNQYEISNVYYSWADGTVFRDYEACIKFINDTDSDLQISKLSIGSCACDSGNQTFSAFGNPNHPAVKGYGGRHYTYISVSNDTPGQDINYRHYERSSKVYNNVPAIGSAASSATDEWGKRLNHHNMNSRGGSGSSASNTASFGLFPYGYESEGYSRYTGIAYKHEYAISNSPIIQPGGIAFIHLGFEFDASLATQVMFKFSLKPSEINVDLEPRIDPYVWQYSRSDNKWHLRKPFYVEKSHSWKNVEELDR